MQIRKMIVATSLLVAPAMLAPVRARAEQKIAFVDLEYALNNVDEGKKAKAILEQDYKHKKEELDATRASLQKMEIDLKSQALVLTDDARRAKEGELSQAREKFDADSKAARESWQKKEDALTRDLLERLTTIVGALGKEGGYTFILERHDASVLYAKEEVDLTKQVVERFNKNGGK
jgi:outer membrane protein